MEGEMITGWESRDGNLSREIHLVLYHGICCWAALITCNIRVTCYGKGKKPQMCQYYQREVHIGRPF